MLLLDFLFPKSCVKCKRWGRYLCDTCFSTISFLSSQTCIECGEETSDGWTHKRCKTPDSLEGVFSSVHYGKTIERLLWAYKNPPYVKEMGKVLSPFLHEGIVQNELFYTLLTSSCILLPIPIPSQTKRERGYSEREEMALFLKGIFHKKVFAHIEKQNIPKSTPLILINDVLITGSTLKNAGKKLKQAGYEQVWGITLAQNRKKST